MFHQNIKRKWEQNLLIRTPLLMCVHVCVFECSNFCLRRIIVFSFFFFRFLPFFSFLYLCSFVSCVIWLNVCTTWCTEFTDVYLSTVYLLNHVKGPSLTSIAFLGTLHGSTNESISAKFEVNPMNGLKGSVQNPKVMDRQIPISFSKLSTKVNLSVHTSPRLQSQHSVGQHPEEGLSWLQPNFFYGCWDYRWTLPVPAKAYIYLMTD